MFQNVPKTSENEKETCQTCTFSESVRIEKPKYNNDTGIRDGSGLHLSVSIFISQIIQFVIKVLEMTKLRIIYLLSRECIALACSNNK